ncbi:MAG: OsmC family protein [Chloroflexi bacterium]|nr:OsmC family protein [Chloroflexota bacterium]
MSAPDHIREYVTHARSTDTFGRVLCQARNHHFVVDGPVQNGCPGEAVTPAEIFLAGIAACGVELVQVLARQRNVPLTSLAVTITGTMDRSRPARPDLTLFNGVQLRFQLRGVNAEQGRELIEAFKRR